MNENKQLENEDWQPCPQGEFQRLSSRLRANRTRRQILKTGVAASALALVGIGSWSIFTNVGSRNPEAPLRGLTCTQCVDLAEDYKADKLPAQQKAQVEAHVRECPLCKPHFQQMGIEIS